MINPCCRSVRFASATAPLHRPRDVRDDVGRAPAGQLAQDNRLLRTPLAGVGHMLPAFGSGDLAAGRGAGCAGRPRSSPPPARTSPGRTAERPARRKSPPRHRTESSSSCSWSARCDPCGSAPARSDPVGRRRSACPTGSAGCVLRPDARLQRLRFLSRPGVANARSMGTPGARTVATCRRSGTCGVGMIVARSEGSPR